MCSLPTLKILPVFMNQCDENGFKLRLHLYYLQLIKTSDLDTSHNYLFGFHPHGILATGAFGNFCTEYTGFKELFPGFTPYLHILPVWFGCPFFRDYILGTGRWSQDFLATASDTAFV